VARNTVVLGVTWYATPGLVMTLMPGVVSPGTKIAYKILKQNDLEAHRNRVAIINCYKVTRFS